MKYVRLQANPKDVRVSIRRLDSGWRVTVASRTSDAVVTYSHSDPTIAIDEALLRAEDQGMDGIDRGLEWAYDYPWKEA
jgi:uncharacterized protein YhdP